MPTAAKLIAGVAFALIAWFAANAYVPLLPEETSVGYLLEITAGLGFVCGWIVLGKRAGHGMAEAISTGLRTSITTVFWALLLFSIYVMVHRSTKMLYDGPMEAVLDVFNIGLIYAKLMWDAQFVLILSIGGALGGMVTEMAGRRWS